MLSMQKLPPSSDLDRNHPHGYLSHSQPADRRPSSLSAFSDCPLMDDSLSHRASESTDDASNDSPGSWDADGPSDSSPPGEVGVRIHDASQPFPNPTIGSSKTYRFNVIASPEPDASMVDVAPKVEELDDTDDLQSIKPVGVETGTHATTSTNTADSTATPVNVPRKRGRPRKHPLPIPGGQVKITKGRSKTGCITCRRRKKKCDETKPS
ncbi:hypothetical protein AOCH_007545 [Aspergillus ochraceoroseus]|uniref:Zn(2)-C6 fungal-type domain-containing protein n=1 Tax=Aspergillus ochraceoroseus TaxID=138278 RepID=A0A0F8UNW0_9EURO|nr:hypothetical protein AOCH_007545 [Aspergillus ochraceoroseus]